MVYPKKVLCESNAQKGADYLPSLMAWFSKNDLVLVEEV